MTRDELELVPERVKSGKISWQQAANDLIVFIIRNKQMFGLTKYDEDFISEIIIIFLDRCISAFNSYDKKKGTFFFIYANIFVKKCDFSSFLLAYMQKKQYFCTQIRQI